MVTLHTNLGDISLTLFSEKAPKTVENFLSYVRDGFYDNTLFHRVIEDFMIQGGGLTSGMNEANNGLQNKAGTVAMARTLEPHSASSQFFINLVDNDFLDFSSETEEGWGYCVFAEVIEGMDVVKKIGSVETGSSHWHQDVPVEEVIILSASIPE
jgi:peptidyl-prolyl cis-trans isomerase B (cyclophilin B)